MYKPILRRSLIYVVDDFGRIVLSIITIRAVGRSENPGVPVLFGGHNLPPLVEIGLTDLPKTGGATGTPGTPRDDRLANAGGRSANFGVHLKYICNRRPFEVKCFTFTYFWYNELGFRGVCILNVFSMYLPQIFGNQK